MIEPNWAGALCAQVDPDLWFPPPGTAGEDAKAICRRCHLRPECLEWALHVGYEHGIWGGLSGKGRAAERRRRAAVRRPGRWASTGKRRTAVADLTSAGWSAAEIAAHLHLTPRTVVRYRAGINQINQKVAA